MTDDGPQLNSNSQGSQPTQVGSGANEGAGRNDDQGNMSGWMRFAMCWLVSVSIMTCVAIACLWSPQPPPPPESMLEPQCPAKNSSPPKPAEAKLTRLYPDHVVVSSTAADILVVGCQFSAETAVKFNGSPHDVKFVNNNYIHIELNAADVAAARTIVVSTSNNGSDFGSKLLYVVPPEVDVGIFGYGPWHISQELQLLLLVLFSGAFGSCVYALKSIADYRGERRLYDSWSIYYFIQPIEGAGIAFLLYLVVRGGFLAAGTSADVKSVSLYGICAIAALSGTFSDTAFLKLREIFQTLFKPQDDRGGKMASTLRITTTKLPGGAVEHQYSEVLKAEGGNGPLEWFVTPPLPEGLTLDPVNGKISGMPKAVSETTLKFTVIDSGTPTAQAFTQKITLKIKA